MKKILIIGSIILLGLIIGTVALIDAQKQTTSPVAASSHELGSLTDLSPTNVVETAPARSPEPPGQSTSSVTIEANRVFETLPANMASQILEQIDQNKTLAYLRQFTGETPICIEDECHTIQSRETGSDGLQWTKAYIRKELVDLGYSVQVLDWSREGYAEQNLMVRKPGVISPEEEIYFVAHMDGVDSPAADDNASGVVDLLSLASSLNTYSFDRTIVFFFSTGEEHGALGVSSYVDQLSLAELNTIKYVVNIDMVGYDADQDGAMELWPGDLPASLEFADDISQTIKTAQLDLVPSIVTGCA